MNARLCSLTALCLVLGLVTAGHSQTDPVISHAVVIDGPPFFTLFSPLVLEPVGATGVIDQVGGFLVTDTEAALTSAFTTWAPLTLTILDGDQAGLCLQIVDFTATTLTCEQELSGLALAGAAYELRKTPTVESLFRQRGLASGSASVADIIWIPNESGNYTRIFRSGGGLSGVGWRGVGIGARDMSETPIAPWKGVFIQRRWGPALTIDFAGAAPTTPLRVPLRTGFNPVSRGTLSPLTLAGSRMQESLAHGTPATADVVWNPDGSGVYARYFWSAGGLVGVGWRRVGGGSVDCGNVPLASAFLIQRLGPPTTVTLPPKPE